MLPRRLCSSVAFRAAVEARRATKRFLPEPVPRPVLDDILELTQKSPSSFNMQPYVILMVSQPERNELLADAMLDNNVRVVRQAPVTAVFLADREPERLVPRVAELEAAAGAADAYVQRLGPAVAWFAGGGGCGGALAQAAKGAVAHALSPLQPMPMASRPDAWAAKNAGMAAQSFMLAAAAHGVATAPMEGFDEERVRLAVGAPDRYAVPMVVAAGYADGPPLRDSPRREVVQWEWYEEGMVDC